MRAGKPRIISEVSVCKGHEVECENILGVARTYRLAIHTIKDDRV